MLILISIWFVGWIATLAFAKHRLHVNYQRGYIANPDDPIAFIAMAVRLMPWPYFWVKYAVLCRSQPHDQ